MADADEGKFLVTGGLWVAVDRRALGVVPGTETLVIQDAHGIQAGVEDGRPVVIFFTDKDLAETFVEWKDKMNLRAYPLDSLMTLALILKDLQADGYEKAGFDVGVNGKPIRGAFITDILADIKRQCPEDFADEP
jgi:hypothetical protein